MTRNIIMLLLLGVVGVAFWSYRHDEASNLIKADMLTLVDEMDFSPVGREDVKRLIQGFHADVFERALDVAREHGSKFDDVFYYNEIYRKVVDQLRLDGDEIFADKVERLKSGFSIAVTEK